MSWWSLPGLLWLLAGAIVLAYVGFYIGARQPVAIRLSTVGSFCTVAVIMRLGLWIAGWSLPAAAGEAVVLIGAASGMACLFARRTWLMRDTLAHLREQLQTAAAGLFLQIEEPQPGCFKLPSRAGPCALSVRPLTTRWLLVTLPPAERRSKVGLLVSWLSKQYPGPIPRPRIILKGSQT